MLPLLSGYNQELQLFESYIKQKAVDNRTVEILEAGCGQRWVINLKDINYRLTGVDVDKEALEIRKFKTQDLHEIIEGDLCSIHLEEEKYDVIYNSYVLEHINGAAKVLENFQKWLKPGGILILRFPDRNSAYGFITRITPFWFHVLIKRVMGNRNAGKPGFDPYPVFYDHVVSRNGIHAFCKEHKIQIKEEWGHPFPMPWDRFKPLLSFAVKIIHLSSFGKLADTHNNLTYILQKN